MKDSLFVEGRYTIPINIFIYIHTHYIVMSDVYLHGNVGIPIYTIHVYCLLLCFEPSFFLACEVYQVIIDLACDGLKPHQQYGLCKNPGKKFIFLLQK